MKGIGHWADAFPFKKQLQVAGYSLQGKNKRTISHEIVLFYEADYTFQYL
jgi:hypothetical protein